MRMISTPIALGYEQFAAFAGEEVALYARHLLAVRPGLDLAAYFEAMKLCEASSFAGVPSVAVPTGLRDGLPAGVQVISRMYREDLALDAAAVLETRLRPSASVF
jgi:amidase